MGRFQGAIIVACICILAATAVPLTETERKAKPSKAVSGRSDRLLAPIDNAIKTESDEEQQHRTLPLPQSLLPPPAAAAKKAAVKEAPKPKVDSSEGEFVTGHRIPPEIIERRNKAAAAAAYVDSSSFRQAASAASAAPPLPPPALSSRPLLDYALLSDESDHAFFSTRDSFLPDYEFEY